MTVRDPNHPFSNSNYSFSLKKMKLIARIIAETCNFVGIEWVNSAHIENSYAAAASSATITIR